MERAIPKTSGLEFASLLQQLGADYRATPHSPRVRAILREIDPDCKDRLPKRGSKKVAEDAEEATKQGRASKKPAPPKSAGKDGTSAKKEKSKKAIASAAARETKKKSSTKRLAKKKPR